jgi:hypothetical protein
MSAPRGHPTPDRPASREDGPPVLPLPRRIDIDHAFDVYVAGRSRMWTEAEKRSAAGPRRGAETWDPERLPGPGDLPGAPRIGVGVPDRLVFHRGAGTWRDAVPGGPGRPRSGDRTD